MFRLPAGDAATFYYQNILATRINAESIIEWVSVIKKNNSKNTHTNFSSYVAINTPEKCILEYNGDIRNLDEDISKRRHIDWFAYTHALVKAEIDTDGKVERKTIYKPLEMNSYTFSLKLVIMNQTKELLLLTQQHTRMHNQRFISLNL